MFFNQISFRVAVWYSFAFLLSSFLLFAVTAFFLVNSLQSKDRQLLIEKWGEYSSLYSREGASGLRTKSSRWQIENAQNFVVRLSDSNGKTLFIHSPSRDDDPDAPTLDMIDRTLNNVGENDWVLIQGGGYGDAVEVYSKKLSSGETLQVGKDTEDREAFLQSFTSSYFLSLIPIFIFAIAIGSFVSRRLLKPIRRITETVEEIRRGDPAARVETSGTKDELGRLSVLFNAMLEQNEMLIRGMRETVDSVAHELRTPIMRLQNSVEHALMSKGEINDFREALLDCQENSQTILKLIDGILDINEAEAGALVLKIGKFPILEVIERAIEFYDFVAEDRGIKIIVHPAPKVMVNADPLRLLQVVSNVLDNAIKYSEDGKTIEIEIEERDTEVLIRVIDQGVGISNVELSRIWDRLYRSNQTNSKPGLGLGLSLVKAIVEAHKGEVSVHRNETAGMTFFGAPSKVTILIHQIRLEMNQVR